MLEYGDILHHDTDLPLDVVTVWGHIFAENGNRAFVVPKQREQAVDGCSLAGAAAPPMYTENCPRDVRGAILPASCSIL